MKVLIVKLTSMGDVLFALSIVGDLARHRPDIRIDWAVDESFADLVKSCRGVDQVWSLPFRALSRKFRIKTALAALKTLFKIRSTRYECVIDLQGMIKSTAVALIARGDIRWTYRRDRMAEPMFHRFFDHYFDSSKTVAALENYRRIGATVFGYTLVGQADFMLQPPLANASNSQLPLPAEGAGLIRPFVVIFPFASKVAKVIPSDQVIHLVELAAQSLPHHQLVMLAGSQKEWDQAQQYSRQSTIRAMPRLSLRDTIRLMTAADGFIGADTGLTYIAAASGVPTVALFSSTDPSVLDPALWARRAAAFHLSEPDWPLRTLSILMPLKPIHD